MANAARATRERILVAADEVFSTEGVRRGCINRIAERAGITKRTLYHHFRSKDDLIAAYLAGRERLATDRLRRWLETDACSTAEGVERLLDQMEAAAADPRWSGCDFLRAAFELAELPGHPGRMVVATHKRCLEARLGELLAREGHPDARAKARRLMLVIDGTVAQLVVHKDPGRIAQARELVRLILGEGITAAREVPPEDDALRPCPARSSARRHGAAEAPAPAVRPGLGPRVSAGRAP